MADNPNAPAVAPRYTITSSSSEQAPFIYFDGVSCMGTNHGAIQIELAANILMLAGVGTGVSVEVIQIAHLRCSPAAAADLRQSIDQALALLQQGQQQTAVPAPGSKPN